MTAPIDTTFISGTTITSDWLNGVNDTVNNLPSGIESVSKLETRYTDDVLAVGKNADNLAQGLQIGGGDVSYGSNGVMLAPDGHYSWLRMQPSANESPIEVVIYPTGSQGIATANSGTSTITRVSGTAFTSAWVGKKFYLGTSVYRVLTVPDANNITVSYLYGEKSVPFASTYNETFHVCYVSGSGTCSVSGSTVTRISGDPFIPFFTGSFVFKINGTTRTVSSFADISTYGLSAAPGDTASATYTFETDINDQLSTLRIQKLAGDDEENLSIFTNYFGHQIRSLYAGNGKERNIYIGTADKNHLSIYANGDLTIGGVYNQEAVRVLYAANGVNRLETAPAATGFYPAWRTRGADTNVGLGFDTKGAGVVTFTSNSFGAIEFQVFGLGGTSWLAVESSASEVPTLSANGAAADIDLKLAAKGAGRIWTGPWASNVDAAVNGYILVKDSVGMLRKLATIA